MHEGREPALGRLKLKRNRVKTLVSLGTNQATQRRNELPLSSSFMSRDVFHSPS